MGARRGFGPSRADRRPLMRLLSLVLGLTVLVGGGVTAFASPPLIVHEAKSCGAVQGGWEASVSYPRHGASYVSCRKARQVANRALNGNTFTYGGWSCYRQSADRFPVISRCYLDGAGTSRVHATVSVVQVAE